MTLNDVTALLSREFAYVASTGQISLITYDFSELRPFVLS